MKKIASLILALAMFVTIFTVAAPSASAANIDYPWMYLENEDDVFYTETTNELIFTLYREYNYEYYYTKIYDQYGYLQASSSTYMNKSYGSTVELTLTWDTIGYEPGWYTIETSSEYYSYGTWWNSPNYDTYYVYLYDGGAVSYTGWEYDGYGWSYITDDGDYCYNEWLLDNGYWYYFSGYYMVTGWNNIDGTWYYMSSGGQMQKGWVYDSSTWYYMHEWGGMATGWQLINGNWYFFNDYSGAMQTGWKQIGGTWYYFHSGGNMATGWVQSGGVWYYMNQGGGMTTGWQLVNGTWYYMNYGGVMQTGWQFIDNTWYYFNSNGAWVA